MYGAIEKHDFQLYMLLFCISVALALFIIAGLGIWMIVKRNVVINVCFTLVTFICAAFLILLGIVLMVVGIQGAKEVNKLCDKNTTDTRFQRALNSLYFVSDMVFCTAPPTGCICYTTHKPAPTNIQGNWHLG